MSLETIAVLGQIFSSVAVLITLFVVVRELRHSTRASRASAYQAFVSHSAAITNAVMTDQRLSACSHRMMFSDAGLEDFDEADRTSLILLTISMARMYEAVHHQVSERVLSQSALHLLGGMKLFDTRVWAEGMAADPYVSLTRLRDVLRGEAWSPCWSAARFGLRRGHPW